jgi:beta-lactam-binding protein with PASTA domain/predicted Ser/Thr protein kinase
MIGEVLGNRYRIEERIGGGGMSVVFRAADLQLGREVAVKVMRSHLVADEDFVRRFWREAQNAAALSHPNLVQIYDVGRDKDHCYIVMELISGRTLKQLIQEEGPVPLPEAVRIAAQILEALGHAHRQKIIHRDVKPHNVLIARDGTVKVADFGIARATTTDTVTHTGSIMGSAHYFSPEQANGYPADEKSDLYSVGVVLYEMVTGRVPFQGESPITVAIKHIRDAVTPPSALNPEIPVELDAIIIKAMAKEPSERFADASEMRLALERFQEDLAAGRTHAASGDFPTQDLRALGSRKERRLGTTAKAVAEVEALKHDDDDDEEERPLTRAQKQRRAVWISSILVVLFGLFGAGAWAFFSYVNVPTIQMPNVIGMSIGQAQQVLSEQKLEVKVRKDGVFDDKIPANAVAQQDPPPDTPVKAGGRVVWLTLSKGPEQLEVPNVLGKTEDEARALLESDKFVVGKVTYKDSSEPEGRVIEQLPGPKTIQKSGATVDLVVSRGRLKVPAVVGLRLDDAQKLIQSVGLTVGKVETQYDLTKPKETVLSSDPAPGSAIASGTQVNLVVATDTPPTGTTPPGGGGTTPPGGGGTTPPGGGTTPPGKPTSFTKEVTVPAEAGTGAPVQIILVDETGEQVLATATLKAGDKVTVRGQFQGKAYLKVMVSGTERQRIDLP